MIRNAFVFVVDALRWDYLPKSVADLGAVRKTVAASTISPTAFASVFSGLHAPQHGVQTFYHRLSRDRTLLSLDGVNTSFWQLIPDGGLYDVLGQDPAERTHLEDIEPPFVHAERELSTHEPYDRWDDAHLEARERGEAEPFLERYKGRWEELRGEYAAGAATAADRFQDRLDTLESRGLLEETLVILTADHGELLGEYGEWSHSEPMVPELVYVPTVLVHPGGDEPAADLLRHIDLLPTVAAELNLDVPWTTAGVNVYEETGPGYGYTEFSKPKRSGPTTEHAPIHRRYAQVHRGVFGCEGGWAFNDSHLFDRVWQFPVLAHRLLDPRRLQDLKHAPRGFYHHWAARRSFGNPVLSASEARAHIEAVQDLEATTAEAESLSEEQVDRLRDLGYV